MSELVVQPPVNEQAAVGQLNEDMAKERAEALQKIASQPVLKLVEVNGVIVTEDEAKAAQESGDPIGPYGHSGRR